MAPPRRGARDPKTGELVQNDESPSLAIFISHSSADADLAGKLAELFQRALTLSSTAIRCTSVNSYRLEVGADTNEQLRAEVKSSRVFVGVMTPSSVASTYVIFELGARWGSDRRISPVVARGTQADKLPGPIGGKNALDLSDRSQVMQLVRNIGEQLAASLEPSDSYVAAVDAVIKLASLPVPASTDNTSPKHSGREKSAASAPSLSQEEITILEVLSKAKEVSGDDVLRLAQIRSIQRMEFFMTNLEKQDLIYRNHSYYDADSSFSLSQRGRKLLMEKGLL